MTSPFRHGHFDLTGKRKEAGYSKDLFRVGVVMSAALHVMRLVRIHQSGCIRGRSRGFVRHTNALVGHEVSRQSFLFAQKMWRLHVHGHRHHAEGVWHLCLN